MRMCLHDMAAKCEPTSSLRHAPKETATCFHAGPPVDDLRAPRQLTLTTWMSPPPRSTVPHILSWDQARPQSGSGAFTYRTCNPETPPAAARAQVLVKMLRLPFPPTPPHLPRGHSAASMRTPGGFRLTADNADHTGHLPGPSQRLEPNL